MKVGDVVLVMGRLCKPRASVKSRDKRRVQPGQVVSLFHVGNS